MDKLTVGVSLAKDVATLLAALLAAAWFCAKWQFGRRAIITVDCAFFQLQNAQTVLAEVAVKLKNVGDVKQDLYGFDLCVRSLDESPVAAPQGNRRVDFTHILIPENIVQVHDGDLRPGVERLYTLPFVLNQPSALIQVSVAIRYHPEKPAINKVEKIFIATPAAET